MRKSTQWIWFELIREDSVVISFGMPNLNTIIDDDHDSFIVQYYRFIHHKKLTNANSCQLIIFLSCIMLWKYNRVISLVDYYIRDKLDPIITYFWTRAIKVLALSQTWVSSHQADGQQPHREDQSMAIHRALQAYHQTLYVRCLDFFITT